MFTNLLEMHIPEADVANSGAMPKILARFNPKTPGKLVRVQLELNQPYEFAATEGGTKPGPLGKHGVFEPVAELRIVRDDTAALVGRTSTVEWKYIPSMGVSVSEGMLKGIPSKMVVEFDPTDTNTYRIEFKAPKKGFQRYRLLVEQQGLERD